MVERKTDARADEDRLTKGGSACPARPRARPGSSDACWMTAWGVLHGRPESPADTHVPTEGGGAA